VPKCANICQLFWGFISHRGLALANTFGKLQEVASHLEYLIDIFTYFPQGAHFDDW